MISLVIPVLSRYDLLAKLIESADSGTLVPDRYFIIDNGTRLSEFHPEILKHKKVDVFTPKQNIGVAAAWNLGIRKTEDIRIISNDDVSFYKNSIATLVKEQDSNTVSCASGASLNAFSLFVIPDTVVKTVGYFDENISPNWAYFEDNDYAYRMKLAGLKLHVTSCEVGHFGSATLKSLTPQAKEMHHKKFRIAQQNYILKWGGLPGNEVYSVARPLPSSIST